MISLVYDQKRLTGLAVNTRFAARRITGVERFANEVIRLLGSDIRLVGPPGSVPWMPGQAWEQLILPLAMKPGELLWSPANTGPLLVSDQVVTIHDLSWIEFSQSYRSTLSLWYRFLVPRLIQRVQCVITVSAYSKLRIISRYQISENRVKVVPGGVDQQIFKPIDYARQCFQPFSLPERYILYVGSLGRHKNLTALCEAWKLLQRRCPQVIQDIHIVIAGSTGRVFQKVDLPVAEGIIYLGYVEEKYLPSLYSAALAFINPSSYEGFGLTLLEAMACGTPVLSSRAGALQEVAGEAAILFQPDRVEEIANCLCRIILDGDLRQELQKRGFERAALFSWETSAARVRQILQSAAG